MSNESSLKVPQLNLNSVLLTIVLGISGWTLVTLTSQAQEVATVRANEATTMRELLDIRVRLTRLELDVQQTRIQLATLEAQRKSDFNADSISKLRNSTN